MGDGLLLTPSFTVVLLLFPLKCSLYDVILTNIDHSLMEHSFVWLGLAIEKENLIYSWKQNKAI